MAGTSNDTDSHAQLIQGLHITCPGMAYYCSQREDELLSVWRCFRWVLTRPHLTRLAVLRSPPARACLESCVSRLVSFISQAHRWQEVSPDHYPLALSDHRLRVLTFLNAPITPKNQLSAKTSNFTRWKIKIIETLDKIMELTKIDAAKLKRIYLSDIRIW